MALSNVMYVLGAVAAATLLSCVVMLRHRRPKSLESGIEMFSRELKALQPEEEGRALRGSRALPSGRPRNRTGGGAGPAGTLGRRGRGPGAASGSERAGNAAGAGVWPGDGTPGGGVWRAGGVSGAGEWPAEPGAHHGWPDDGGGGRGRPASVSRKPNAGASGWSGTWPTEDSSTGRPVDTWGAAPVPKSSGPAIQPASAFSRPAPMPGRGGAARRRSRHAPPNGRIGRNEAPPSSPPREDQPG